MNWNNYFSVCFIAIFALLFASPVYSQVEVSQKKLKDRFFGSLTQSQKIELMEAIDRSKQYTSFELGAKYKWGRIPPDRQPPFQLARWWESLSPLERRQQRLKWFEENYRSIDLDRAVRELGLQERLTKMYRQLAEEKSRVSSELETVPFPDGPLTFGDTEADRQLVFRQSGNERIFRQSEESTSDKETEPSRKKTEETQPSAPDQPDEKPQEEPDWKRVREIGDQVIIFKKENGEIKIIRKDGDGDEITKEELFKELDMDTPTLQELNILNIPHPRLRRNQ